MEWRSNLGDISTYRTELMGIATILILICHGPANGVEVPAIIDGMMRWCGVGVDLFLFLSGVGMYFSLRKRDRLIHWYLHRYTRILLPFLIFAAPYYLFRLYVDGGGLITFLFNITTISFWTAHEGAWFVAMLLPLYLLTPWIAKMTDSCRNRTIPTIILCLVSVAGYLIPTTNEIFKNVQMCLGHVPAFFIGYWIGRGVYEKLNINVWHAAWGGYFMFFCIRCASKEIGC